MKTNKESFVELKATVSAIADAVDKEWAKGLKNIFYVGNGGTYSYGMPIEFYARRNTEFPVFNEQSAELVACGHKLLGKGSLCIFDSATGNTPDLNRAMEFTRKAGAVNLAMVNKPEDGKASDSPMKALADYFFEVDSNLTKYAYLTPVMRVMNLRGEFDGYDKMWDQLANCGEALDQAAKDVINKSAYWAARNHDPMTPTYFVGAGATYGAAYCLGMCVFEEMQWMRTKIIHAGEFFHGALELVVKDTPFIVIKGEDEDRELIERVERFIAPLTQEVLVYDTKEIDMPLDEEFRKILCAYYVDNIIYVVDKSMQDNTGHDLKVRRYYRYMNY